MARRNGEFTISPIGYINRTDYGVELCVKKEFREGLLHLDRFSHVMVIWWPHLIRGHPQKRKMRVKPFYAPDTLTGVFATRSPSRPNPVAVTTCHIREIHEPEGIILVNNIDAEDGSPILDMKPHFPCLDVARNPRIPEWLPDEWAEPIPDEGVGPE